MSQKLDSLRAYLKANRSILIYIVVLFVATRIAISLIGYIALDNIPHAFNAEKDQLSQEHPYLHIWAVWDSEWYLKIADQGYADSVPFVSDKYSTIGFFPLYPVVSSALAVIVRDSLYSSLLVSNILLLVSAFLLYKLIRLDHDENVGRRAILYLFLFPSSYILSAVYPESMLLCLWLACFLMARKNKWLFAGSLGFLAALTKPMGALILIPLLWMYIQNVGFSLKKIRANIINLALIPMGILLWMALNYVMTGDMLAFSHVQQTAWYHHLSMPFTIIYQNLFAPFVFSFNSIVIILALLILCLGYKKISFSYWIFSICAILFNPTTGTVVSSLRYCASIFPIILILAIWGERPNVDKASTSVMALLQGCMVVFWVLGFGFLM